jgi:CubicO group peptidase (beta-lactamase class C family)
LHLRVRLAQRARFPAFGAVEKTTAQVRKSFIISTTACALLVACAPTPAPPPPPRESWPTNGWRSSTPEAQGIDSRVLASALETLRAERIPVHSVFVERSGYAVLDAYFFPFAGGETHDLASVTKSVLSSVVGVAQREGRIGGPNTPLSVLLPEQTEALDDPRKGAITLGELLSMTSGLDCNAAPGENLLREMEQSPDWVAFMLDRPLGSEPGTRFEYCGGAMHIVSAALTRALGESAAVLADREIFAPLGIARSTWPSDGAGNSRGFADLELSPRDAAKLGYLWLHQGTWEDKQIIPSNYLAQSLVPHAQVQAGIAYGYGFWLYPSHVPFDFEANGRGGQRITIVPSQNLVEVVTAGGADANVVARLLAPAIRSERPLAPDPIGDERLATAVADAARPPAPAACGSAPPLAKAISGVRFLVSENPIGLRSIVLTFPTPCETVVGMGFSDGTTAFHPVGMDGVPRLSPDPASGHRVAVSGAWRANGFDLDYDEVALIDDYRLRLTGAGQGLRIHLTERTGLVDADLSANPG